MKRASVPAIAPEPPSGYPEEASVNQSCNAVMAIPADNSQGATPKSGTGNEPTRSRAGPSGM